LDAEKQDMFASVVAVVGDDPAILRPFLDELCRLIDSCYSNYEVVLVDNGAAAPVVAAIRPLLAEYKCVRLVRLSRRMDDETAVLAGLDSTIGDFVVTMDPDLDPSSEIPKMIEKCRDGNDLVLGVDRARLAAGPIYRFARGMLFPMVRWLVGVQLVRGATMLRALNRQAVNALTQNRLRKRYFQVVAADVGLNTTTHAYTSRCLSGRPPKARLFRAIRIGLSVLVHNSITPLRLVSVLGVFGSLLSLGASLYTVVIYLVKSDVAPGWTTLSLLASGLFFLAFLMLTLIGEYLGRLLEQTSDRPLYYVREEQSSAVMLSDLTRRNVLERSEAEPRRATTEIR
jgi:polyisoprenyl-phosphate glycosyltransferase